MDWRSTNLYGAADIARVCNVYEIGTLKVPSAKFKVKVLEQGRGGFFAIPNVCLKDANGSPDWEGFTAKTEQEALQELLRWFMDELNKRENPTDDDFEWAECSDF